MQLLSDKYRAQLIEKHKGKPWGGGGWSWIGTLVDWMIRQREFNPTILDFGSGRSTFKQTMAQLMPHIQVYEYDPGIPGKQTIPVEPIDVVICTDVMEHVELEFVNNTIKLLGTITGKFILLNIACAPSKSLLPDGSNAHVTVMPPLWWRGMFERSLPNFELHLVKEGTKSTVFVMVRK